MIGRQSPYERLRIDVSHWMAARDGSVESMLVILALVWAVEAVDVSVCM